MYHIGQATRCARVTRDGEKRVTFRKGSSVRRLHKAFLRYHDPNNWPLLREALQRMGRGDLIGNGKQQLVPRFQPKGTGKTQAPEGRRTVGQGPAVSHPARPLIRLRKSGSLDDIFFARDCH